MINCPGSEHEDATEVQNDPKMNEIVVYIDSKIQIRYEDGVFKSEVREYSEKLNDLLAIDHISVKPLVGKNAVSKTDSIFFLTVRQTDTQQLLKDLGDLVFVNAAYMKPQSEEPSMDD